MPDGWQSAELQQFTSASAPTAIRRARQAAGRSARPRAAIRSSICSGPPPDHDCILSISRLGRLYVLEDGNGQVLFENDNPMLLAEQATAALRRRKASHRRAARGGWCAVREAFEEKVEAMMAEPIELLTHFAPQLAALA